MSDATLTNLAKQMLSTALDKEFINEAGYNNLIQGASSSVYFAGMLNAAAEKGVAFKGGQKGAGVKFDGQYIVLADDWPQSNYGDFVTTIAHELGHAVLPGGYGYIGTVANPDQAIASGRKNEGSALTAEYIVAQQLGVPMHSDSGQNVGQPSLTPQLDTVFSRAGVSPNTLTFDASATNNLTGLNGAGVVKSGDWNGTNRPSGMNNLNYDQYQERFFILSECSKSSDLTKVSPFEVDWLLMPSGNLNYQILNDGRCTYDFDGIPLKSGGTASLSGVVNPNATFGFVSASLTGNAGSVRFSNAVITLADGASATVNGSDNTINLGSNDNLTVNGSNVVNVAGIQTTVTEVGSNASLTVNGNNVTARATGDQVVLTTTGDNSSATTTGSGSSAKTTGTGSLACAAGDYSAAVTTGYAAQAYTAGTGSLASTSGAYSTAVTTGYAAEAFTSGYAAQAYTTGAGSLACTTGDYSTATTNGYAAQAYTTGTGSAACTTGDYSTAATNGYAAQAYTTGTGSAACATGDYSTAATTGSYADAVSTGNYSSAHSSGNYSSAYDYSGSSTGIDYGSNPIVNDYGNDILTDDFGVYWGSNYGSNSTSFDYGSSWDSYFYGNDLSGFDYDYDYGYGGFSTGNDYGLSLFEMATTTTNVNQLVQAMASFAPSSAGQSNLLAANFPSMQAPLLATAH
jgi:hypothetical protein